MENELYKETKDMEVHMKKNEEKIVKEIDDEIEDLTKDKKKSETEFLGL